MYANYVLSISYSLSTFLQTEWANNDTAIGSRIADLVR